ncbi:MAG: molybdopterin-binding protein [Ilumatobacteraceae bacterium]
MLASVNARRVHVPAPEGRGAVDRRRTGRGRPRAATRRDPREQPADARRHVAARPDARSSISASCDDEDALGSVLLGAAASCGAIVTSGGVSMGDYDVVKAVLGQIADMTWMQIAIKPAKPFAFGKIDGTPIFGLPGNPVSSIVSFEMLARPALRRMMGHRRLARPSLVAVADEGLPRRSDGKVHLMRSPPTSVTTADATCGPPAPRAATSSPPPPSRMQSRSSPTATASRGCRRRHRHAPRLRSVDGTDVVRPVRAVRGGTHRACSTDLV